MQKIFETPSYRSFEEKFQPLFQSFYTEARTRSETASIREDSTRRFRNFIMELLTKDIQRSTRARLMFNDSSKHEEMFDRFLRYYSKAFPESLDEFFELAKPFYQDI
jgi:hypothetical protein